MSTDLVPCVRVVSPHCFIRCVGAWVPVLGPLHDDAEIVGFPERHWHVDWRYFTAAELRRVKSHHRLLPSYLHSVVLLERHTEGGVQMRERRRLREMPHHPVEGGEYARPQHRVTPAVAWLRELENAYEDSTAKCGVCPHRGLPLGSITDAAGHHVCSGHGLTWDPQSGALVRRTARIHPHCPRP